MLLAPPTERHRLARSVARSGGAQLVARLIHLGVNVGVVLALIRYFGPDRYGDYVFVITVTSLLALVSEFGLKGLAVLHIARDPTAAESVLGTVLAARLAMAVISAVVAQLVCLAFQVGGHVQLAVAVSSLLFATEAVLSITVIFHVALRQEYEAFVRSLMEIVELVIVIVLIRRSAGLVAIVTAPVASAALGAVIAVLLARRRFGLKVEAVWAPVGAMLVEAIPLAAIGIVGVLYLKLDALVLAAMRPASSVGIYGAAFQPIENLLITATILVNVLFPLAAASYGSDRSRFGGVYRGGTEALLAVVLPVPVLLAVLAPDLVAALYEPRYNAAVAPLRVLGVAVVFMVVNVWQGFVLLAAGRQRITLVYVSAAIALNVAVDIPLISWLGTVGAAWGTLATAVFLAACSTAAVSRVEEANLDVVRLVQIAVPSLALAIEVVVLHGPLGVAWWLVGFVGVVSWPLWLRVTGVFSIRQARELLTNRNTGNPQIAPA